MTDDHYACHPAECDDKAAQQDTTTPAPRRHRPQPTRGDTMTAASPGPAADLLDHAAGIIVASQQQPHTAPYHWAAALWKAGLLHATPAPDEAATKAPRAPYSPTAHPNPGAAMTPEEHYAAGERWLAQEPAVVEEDDDA